MLYYVKLEKNQDVLDIQESPSINNLAKRLKMSWGDLNYYLNGTDREVKWLPCGIIMPLIKRNGNIYLISYLKGWIEMKNYPGMSNDIINDIYNLSRNADSKQIWTHRPIIKHSEDDWKVSTDIITQNMEDKRRGGQ